MSNDEFTYGSTIRGIVERIAFEIGDAADGDSYANFDEAWIKARVLDTFKWLQGRRPDLFAHEETFELEAGAKQSLPEGCDTIISGVSVLAYGKEHPVYDTDFSCIKAARAYESLTRCNRRVGLFHISEDENEKTSFWFSPPVPVGESYTLTATCSNASRYFDDPDREITCEIHKWVNTVIEYVKFVAFSTDGDNPVNQSLADQHRATFFDLAPVQRRQPDA